MIALYQYYQILGRFQIQPQNLESHKFYHVSRVFSMTFSFQITKVIYIAQIDECGKIEKHREK